MRGRNLMLVAAACGVLAAGCAKPAPEAPAVDLAAEAQTIRDRSAAWMALAQARDAAAIASGMYTADAATMFDGQIHKGTAEIEAGLATEMAASPDSTTSWTTDDVKVAAAGDLAYERGTFSFDPDGAGEKPANDGEFVTVWTKVDGTWRAVVDAGTARKPAEAAAPAGG